MPTHELTATCGSRSAPSRFCGHLACTWCVYIHADKHSVIKTQNKIAYRSTQSSCAGAAGWDQKEASGAPSRLGLDVSWWGCAPFRLGLGRAGATGVGGSRSQSICGTVVPKHLTDGTVRTCSTWIFTDWWGRERLWHLMVLGLLFTAKLLCNFRIWYLSRPILFVVQEEKFYVTLFRNVVDV